MGYVTGFAQGFAESVQAAIEKEQKSMDDLFQTQFKVRLSRRMDALDKDREDLAEASKNLKAYNGFTGDNLEQSAQLYSIGAGMGHDKFLEKLSGIQLEGRNPLEGVIWAEKNSLPVGSTLDEYSRSLIAPPTMAPVEPLQMGGGFISSIQKAFGGAGEYSQAAKRSAERLQSNLQSMAPIREASQHIMAVPTLKEGYRFELEKEKTARLMEDEKLEFNKARNAHLKRNYPNIERKDMYEATIAGETANIAVMTRYDQISLSRDQAKVAKANASLAVLKLGTYEELGKDREQAQLDLAKAQIEKIKDPTDMENAITAVTYKLHQVNTSLESALTTDGQAVDLERKKLQLTKLQARLFTNQQRIEDMSATAPNRTRGLATFIKMHGDMQDAVFNTRTIGKKKQFAYLPDKTGENYRWTIVGGLDNKEMIKAKQAYTRLQARGHMAFMGGITEGTNPDGTPKYVTESAGIAATTYVPRNIRVAWAQREHFKSTPPSVTADMMREKGETDDNIVFSLRNIYNNTRWQKDYEAYIDSMTVSGTSGP